MKETPRAKQAFNDYLAMGPERSLDKLLARYESAKRAPTKRFKTLADWSRHFGWQARLAAIAEEERAAIVAKGISDRQNRVDALNEYWMALRQVVTSRAEHYGALLAGAPKEATGDFHRPAWIAPGAETGVLVFTRKIVGKTTIEEWAADVALFREIREHAKQAAQELGQWEEKHQVAGSVLIREYGVPVNEV